MNKALGLVEVRGLSTAVFVADTMIKTSNVEIAEPENTKGLGWITIKVVGNVGAVNAAVAAGKQVAIASGHYISSKVIPRPANSLDDFFGKEDFYRKKIVEPKQPSANKTSKKSRRANKKAEKKSKNIKTSSAEELVKIDKNPENIKVGSPDKLAIPEKKPENIKVETPEQLAITEQKPEDIKLVSTNENPSKAKSGMDNVPQENDK